LIQGANSDKIISVGKEGAFGEPAEEMHVLGTDKVLKLKVVKDHYNALGNALHIPTMQCSNWRLAQQHRLKSGG
jgi:hypothetical protein